VDIPSNFKPKKTDSKSTKKTGDIESVTLNHLGTPIDIDPKTLHEACAKAAKQAYDLGETNDEGEYCDEMESALKQLLTEKSRKK
jgi:hypothetical protein